MRILIAPDKFKGSITASEAAEAIASGFDESLPGCICTLAPIADGGEGFAEAMRFALGGSWIPFRALDPLGREVDCRYAWVDHEKIAIIEMAEASGIWRLTPKERDPLRAHSFGTGQLMLDAVARGAKRILVGLGGSATTDGGAGMAAALGYEFLTDDGVRLSPQPRDLESLSRISAGSVVPLPEVIAACDVRNPLLGERGTARVFAPQKGADAPAVERLEAVLTTLSRVATESLGTAFQDSPGAGAAGGFGFGLLTFTRASVRAGFDLVAEALHLQDLIAAAELIVTGEGSLDDQTLEGKGPAGIAALARAAGKPVIAFGGSIAPSAENLFDAVVPIVDQTLPLEEAMRHGATLLRRAARRAGRLLRLPIRT
jgi:glycerate kinase